MISLTDKWQPIESHKFSHYGPLNLNQMNDTPAAAPRDDPPLSIDPDAAHFLPSGGRSEHMLVNTSEKRIAVKVRCSDNTLFRVYPVYMFIEPGSCGNLIITRFSAPAKSDKLILHYLTCSASDSQPKDLFQTQNKLDMIKIPIHIVSPEDMPRIGGSSAQQPARSGSKSV